MDSSALAFAPSGNHPKVHCALKCLICFGTMARLFRKGIVFSHKKLSCAYTCLIYPHRISRVPIAPIYMSSFICVDVLIDGKRVGGNGTFMVVSVETTCKEVLSDFLRLHASDYYPLLDATVVTMLCMKTTDSSDRDKPFQDCTVFLDYPVTLAMSIRGPDEALHVQVFSTSRRSSNPSRSSNGNDVETKFSGPSYTSRPSAISYDREGYLVQRHPTILKG
jgi:hypothetical protein